MRGRVETRPRTLLPLSRALSKLGILSRSQATDAIRAGRVSVDGRIVRNPALRVVPERAQILVDGTAQTRRRWRTILLYKPRSVVTTRRDPDGRPTVFDVVGDAGRGLVAVGRLDFATSGLLLLTSDTRLADWITDPRNGVPRIYAVTVRGRIGADDVTRLTTGSRDQGDDLHAERVLIRKASGRESHLIVELREGRNREVRRLLAAVGHEVTRLKRVALGGCDLGSLEPGKWRDLTPREVARAFPGAPLQLERRRP